MKTKLSCFTVSGAIILAQTIYSTVKTLFRVTYASYQMCHAIWSVLLSHRTLVRIRMILVNFVHAILAIATKLPYVIVYYSVEM